ncbi:hypothetical protein GCM10023186_34600 [Hymenobacter koreensis]|uniref:LamG-like jellyroll fold domain-containing protein n=1 Tax=Hymenobacter koreensis TaxID=1084523 RepID=A0ABP8JBJ6_9BACT
MQGAGNTISFNGSTSINCGTNNRGITQQVTVEAWIKTTNSGYQWVMGKYQDSNGDDKGYHLQTFNGLASFHGRAGNFQYYTSGQSTMRVDDGRWHHLVGICAGNTWQIYVDGALVNSTTFNYTNGNIASSAPMAIGMYAGANAQYFQGQIDELRVWRTVRTPAEIRGAMCQKFTTAPSNLVAYFRFDQASGNTLLDEGSVPTNGTLNNFGTTPSWIRSGAAIGDASVSAYPGGAVSLTAANGDVAEVSNVIGPVQGVQLYAVNSAPAVSPGAGAASSYFGVFTSPANAANYTLTLRPQDGSSTGKKMAVRTANDASSWTTPATTNTASAVALSGHAYRGEYILVNNVWTGAVSSVYTDAANWSANVVPGATDDVSIPANAIRMPVLSSAASAAGFTVAAGASMTVAPSGTLSVAGNLTNNGTVTGLGTVTLTGTAQQTLSGTGTADLGYLTVGTAGAQSSLPLQIRRVLTANGNLALTDNTLTLLSDAGATAMLYNVPAASVTGRVTVQRYLDGSLNGGPGYRHLSSPVENPPLADLATASFTPIVNPNYTSSTVPFPNIFYFGTNDVGPGTSVADFDQGWLSPASTTNVVLSFASAYSVNIAGNQMVDFVGTLNTQGRQPIIPQRNGLPQAGWNLIGNPFPGPIDWNVLITGADNVDNALYVFKSSGQYTGSYATYINGVSANGGSNIIPMGQGFFIRTSVPRADFGTIIFSNASRLTSYQNPALQRTQETRPLVQLELRGSTGPADQVTVYLQPGATAGFDAAFDAYKLAGSNATRLAIQAGSSELSISGLPLPGQSPVTVPLLVQVAQPGSYTLEASRLINLPAGTTAFLHDAQTGTRINLAQQAIYSFTATGTTLPGRFSLELNPNRPLAANTALSEQLSVYPNPARQELWLGLPVSARKLGAEVTVVNALGQQVFAQKLPATVAQENQKLALPALARGVYTLRVALAEGVATKRLVIE